MFETNNDLSRTTRRSVVEILQAMRDALATCGGVRNAIDDTTALNDADTADLFTAISRGADKSLWMVEAHVQDTAAEPAPGDRSVHRGETRS